MITALQLPLLIEVLALHSENASFIFRSRQDGAKVYQIKSYLLSSLKKTVFKISLSS